MIHLLTMMLAQAAPATIEGMSFSTVLSAAQTCFAIVFGMYVLWYGLPRVWQTIETITANCEAAAMEKDEKHSALIRDMTNQHAITIKGLTDSFAAEIKLERADRKEEILAERERVHKTVNQLAAQEIKKTQSDIEMGELLRELTAAVKEMKGTA